MNMNRREYERMTEAQLKGRAVITNHVLKNYYSEIPAGTKCTITRKFKGFNLRSEPCKLCGVKVDLSRVNPEAVTLLEEGSQ